MKTNWICILILCLCVPGWAQTEAPLEAAESVRSVIPDDEPQELPEIVVTGTKTVKNSKDSPVKTDVVRSEDIKVNHYRTAADAILDIPGVTLGSATGKLGTTAIMQGLGGDHVLVLIDGVPLTQNSSGGFDLSQIPTTDIERIETVKGAASALYGGQAMGGVINIITKKPTDRLQYAVDVQRDGYLQGQTRDELPYNFFSGQIRGRSHKTSYRLSATSSQKSSLEKDEISVTRDTPDLRKVTASGWLQQDLGHRHKGIVDYSYFDESNTSYFARLQPNSLYAPVENGGEIKTHRLRLGHSVNYEEKIKWNTYVFGEVTDDLLSMEDDPSTSYLESVKTSRLRHYRFETQADFQWHEEHLLTVGAVSDINTLDQRNRNMISAGQAMESVDVDRKDSSVVEAYVQNDWMRDEFEAVAGMRWVYDPLFGENIAPNLNMSYAPRIFDDYSSIFRASVGSGYRIPSLKERYYSLDHRSFAGYMVAGNENLQPEKSVSFNLGFEIQKDESLNLTANLFVNRVNGLVTVDEVPTGTNERRFTYVNMDETLIRGLELGATYYLTSNLRLHHSWTYSRAEDARRDLIIPNRPFYVAQTNVRWAIPSWKSDVVYTWRYFGDSYANISNTAMYDRYSQSDARWNYSFTKNSQLYFGFLNIFNVQTEALKDSVIVPFDQRPAFGSSVFIGFRSEG